MNRYKEKNGIHFNKDILEIKEDCVCVLGIKYPIHVDNQGSILRIKNIKLDTKMSYLIAYQLYCLNFLHSKLDNYQIKIKNKIINLLKESITQLLNTENIDEIRILLKSIEKKRKSLRKELLQFLEIQENAEQII